MRAIFLIGLLATSCIRIASAQVGGNASYSMGNMGYGQAYGRARAEQNERAKRTPVAGEPSPGTNAMFLEASVLMNVKADEYVVLFGISQEGGTLAECTQKLDATIAEFTAALRPLGIAKDAWFVDFVAQNKIYGYKVDAGVANEELAGFELKKNISVHYKDKALLDKLILAAAGAKIFDLIKVDYVVKDVEPVHQRLLEEASRILKQKVTSHQKLLGIKLVLPPQIFSEKPSVYFPTEMYDSYTAYESENVEREQYRSKYVIHGARKSRTFYYNALNADGFDSVINPVTVEPMLQFTLYVKARYELSR
jgi:uncharacterized protein YggE